MFSTIYKGNADCAKYALLLFSYEFKSIGLEEENSSASIIADGQEPVAQ